MTLKEGWHVARRYLSWRTLFDALWMDEPLYVISMMFWYPFDWSLFAASVWVMGTLVMLRQSLRRIAWSFGVATRPDMSKPTVRLKSNRFWMRSNGVFDARIVDNRPLAITAKGQVISGSNVPARSGKWRTRWRRRYLYHLARLKHAAWIAQNIFG